MTGGIALLPHHVCEGDLAAGRLQKVLPDLPIPANPFYLIYPSREHLAPRFAHPDGFRGRAVTVCLSYQLLWLADS